MRKTCAAISSAILLLHAGCTATPTGDAEQEVQVQQSPLFVDSHNIWPTTNISVCWENASTSNATERGWVQSAVANSWEAASGVRFQGWGSCADGSRGIRIQVVDAQPKTTDLGRSLDGKANGMHLNFEFKNWSESCAGPASRQRCIESIAVHEFGHALGFAHEQNRNDTPAWCLTPAPRELAFGDFDADGSMDVFRSNGTLWFVTLDGGASWREWNVSSFHADQLQMGDFNADGATDVFRSTGGTWYVSWNGSGPWQELGTSSYGLGSLGFGDFNGDRATDVFRSTGGVWYVSYGGAGPWQVLNSSSYGLDDLRFGDFNGDRATDVFRSTGGTWYVSFGGSGPWTVLNSSNLGVGDLRFGDFNGDGATDVFYANGSTWYVSWSGTSAWQELNTSSYGLDSLYLGHFDGGRRTDIFRTTSESIEVSFGGVSEWGSWRGTSFRQGSSGDTNLGAWDVSSVMNYCNPIWNNGGVLSATDSAGVAQIYPKPAPPASCTFNGVVLQEGQSLVAFAQSSVLCDSCTSETRVCHNGSLSGSFAYRSCRVTRPKPPAQCP